MRTFKCPPIGFHLHVWSRHVCCWLVSCYFTARLFRIMTSAHWQQQLSWSLTSKPSLVRPAGFVVSAFYLNKLFPFHRVQHWSKAGDFFLFLMRLGFCAFFPWFVLTSALLDLGFLFFAAHLLSTWNMVSCPAVEEQLENSLEKQQKWRLDCWTFHFFPSFPLAKLHVWVMLLTLDQEWMWRKHLSRSQRAWFAETRCWHNIRLHTKGPNLI